MISVEQALRLVEEQCRPLAPRHHSLSEVGGLVLAEDVVSDIDSPPHDKSMMDGFALISKDASPHRRIIEEIAAGDVPRRSVAVGTASRIMTGAPLPPGADAVVPVEATKVDGDRVRLLNANPPPGQNVLPRGASMRIGDIVARRGSRLRPIEIAVLAEAGCATVNVHPRPRVAVLATGNELVEASVRPGPGQIRNSNSHLLLAATAAAGAEASDLGIARDSESELRERMNAGFAADILVLSGGVSAGLYDLVPKVLAELGVSQVFHKIALRPGKPLWFGVREAAGARTLVFGLPGNPVSSFVCCELFVRPAIAALSGGVFSGLSRVVAELDHALDHKGERAACLPARVTWLPASSRAGALPTVGILSWRGSADMATLAQANALACLPAECVSLPAGARLDVLMI